MESKDSAYDTLSVSICDDSALMRNLVSRIINDTPGMQVVNKAINGQMLLDSIPLYKPDIIVLDIEMPVMTGVEFLKERKARHLNIPVIILSSIATQGAAVTMQCLELGASDFITKPGGSASSEVVNVGDELIEKLASYGGAAARRNGKKIPFTDYFLHQIKMHRAEQFVAKKKGEASADASSAQMQPVFSFSQEKKTPAVITPLREGGHIKLIALGISTGGPNALRDVFKMIDPHLRQPILVVQHMPAGFTAEFAQSLDRICPLTVVEAADNMRVEPGHIYIAPGAYHICVEDHGLGCVIKTNQDPPRNGHRPSVDVLFESVAKLYKNNALGVIMTGMGRDGAEQLAEMRRQGAWTLGQDEKSAVVYGMPRVAWELGGVQKQVPLMQMADEISALARAHP
ncbi:MAG: chemotaxis response regulator protein-glutamate methylesterase [Treponemataceae bacterium]|nr:chemotaxis response regulator protein-glutamate methylesterase [Treponemataceae bacterium]